MQLKVLKHRKDKNSGMFVCGNFNRVTKRKPKNWRQRGYKILVPYKFKWRHKIGKVQCDCKQCIECYTPYYGVTWFHSDECSLMKYVQNHPRIDLEHQIKYKMIAGDDWPDCDY